MSDSEGPPTARQLDIGTARQLDIGTAGRVTLDTVVGPVAALRGGTAGPVVLLVPGYTGSKEDFGPLLDPLASAGFDAVAIDLPGQFETPGPTDPVAYCPDALSQSVHAVAAVLGPPVHLLGHSFGGLVTRAAAIAAPRAWRSLTLMGSGPAALGGARRRRIDALAPVLATSGMPGVYAASQAAAAAEPGYVAPPAELARFLERRFLAGSPSMLQGMGEAIIAEPDRVDELAAIGLPMLVLNGSRDDAWSPATQAAMAVRLGAQHVVIDEAAHSPAVEAPAATAAALVAFWHAVDGRR